VAHPILTHPDFRAIPAHDRHFNSSNDLTDPVASNA
jgi:hypothetical protein